jgi:hypothetical protein
MNAMEKIAVIGFVQQLLDERYCQLMDQAKPLPFSNTNVIEARDVSRLFMNNFSHELGQRLEALVESTTPPNPLDRFQFADEKHP